VYRTYFGGEQTLRAQLRTRLAYRVGLHHPRDLTPGRIQRLILEGFHLPL